MNNMPLVPDEGDLKTAKLVLVGESPSTQEVLQGKPFVGPAGFVLDEVLRSCNIPRSSCFITNVFPHVVKKPKSAQGKIFHPDGGLLWAPKAGFTEYGRHYVTKLGQKLVDAKTPVLVALGGTAMSALTPQKAITKYRGSVLESNLVGGKKVIPTVHPAFALHGMYTNRYLIRWDMAKAWREKEYTEIRRPDYSFILRPTLVECLEVLQSLRDRKQLVSCDIEVQHRQVSRICYAWGDLEAISIPYGEANWSLQDEMKLWLATAQFFADEEVPKLFHNCMFDIQFMFMTHHIIVKGRIEDTMLAHHIMYSDFRKGLDFLASLYTNQPYWKDMVKHGDMEKEDG